MADETLLLELIKALRADVAKLSSQMLHLTEEVHASNAHVAAIVKSDLNQNVRFAELEARLDKIEKQLELRQ